MWRAMVVGCLLAGAPVLAQQPPRPGTLFPPEDLGLLEGPDRDAWQRPDAVMDTLGIADGARVADVGAGGGWFTVRLAKRVGPHGVVYAEDIQREMIDAIERRARNENLDNIRPILGTADDPKLPRNELDAVLIVDTYHEVVERIPLLRAIREALRPRGRLGIIDYRLDGGGPGPDMEERIGPETVIEHARLAGLRFAREETFLPYQYLLIFERDDAESEPRHPPAMGLRQERRARGPATGRSRVP